MATIGWRWDREPESGRLETAVAVEAPRVSASASKAYAIAWHRADCCVANAAFRIVIPAGGTRAHRTELLLCGHHFHQSQDRLRGLGAAVYDSSNSLV